MIGIITLLTVVLAVIPLCVFAGLMGDRPGLPPVRPGWHLCLTVSWLTGLLVVYGALVIGLVWLSHSQELSDALFYGSIVLSAPVGAAIGPGLTYLYYRMRTARDPDYGPTDDGQTG